LSIVPPVVMISIIEFKIDYFDNQDCYD